MIKLNENYGKLPGSYLFAEIARRTATYSELNPDKRLIKLGIGDVTLPLPAACVEALKAAADEMGRKESFMGYGPYEGYDFLREAIVKNDYAPRGARITADEIFVSDGAKSDCGNIGDIFSEDNIVAVCDPVYPVYIDANAMSGRAGDWDGGKWTKIVYMPCTAENGFFPELPKTVPDMIYLCFPNNPTGMAATKEQLKPWVDYANEHGSIILYDAAYEAYITEQDVPHSIYEVNGAETCAIEFCSFSKTAGFTGTRCSYTVVPQALVRGSLHLNAMWLRRQTTKYNGVPYIVQRAAAAVFTEEGQKATRAAIDYYRANAAVIAAALDEAGIWYCGGKNSPYIWMQCPGGMKSWDFFDHLLEHAGVVGTPGAGFGAQGEGYFRLTGFGDAEKTRLAAQKLKEAVRVL